MASLIEQYGPANRVVDTALSVRYSRSRITGHWDYVVGTSITTLYEAWSYTRTASKVYRYVGMTKAAALACADAMKAKYQRDIKYSSFSQEMHEFVDKNGGDMPMADIAVNNVAGGMYEVAISVNETDSRTRISDASYAVLFAAENNRDYDEEE